jgi:hypothetical protein
MIKSLLAASVLFASTLVAAPAMAGVDLTTDLVKVTESSPGVFDFSQGGFFGGGVITGSFAGVDSDADGQLSSFVGELTDFHLAYSGGSQVHAFTLGFADLFGLVYDLDGGDLGDGLILDIEGIEASNFGVFYAAGPGPLGFEPCDGSNICGFIVGADVPEPSTWALMTLALGGLGAMLRRSRVRSLAFG